MAKEAATKPKKETPVVEQTVVKNVPTEADVKQEEVAPEVVAEEAPVETEVKTEEKIEEKVEEVV